MVSQTKPTSRRPLSEEEQKALLQPAPLRHCEVSLLQIQQNGYRLDASAYNLEALSALGRVLHSPYGWVPLWGNNGLVKEAYYPGRYKRIYSNSRYGEPFYLPSQLEEVYPRPVKYLSAKTTKLLDGDRIKPDNLLVSRSGTIGKCAISSKTTIGKIFSDDVIRIAFNGECDLGYTYAFLKTEAGLKILQSEIYGSVINHIEPEHLHNVPIPNAPGAVKRTIHEAVVASYALRDQSNERMDAAQGLLYKALQLPQYPQLAPCYYAPQAGFRNFTVKASNLDGRFDASYHLPIHDALLATISQHAKEMTMVGDSRIAKKIVLPSRFRRVYVKKGKGVPFFGGKQLLQLDPSGDKYLAYSTHTDIIKEELGIKENMCLVSCSGTIGKVAIVPRHWKSWVANNHCIRVHPASTAIAGYLYAWLSCDYALPLITRNTYGAVVDEIDAQQLSRVAIPLLKDTDAQKRINELVLQANSLRYEAYVKEQEAIGKMEAVLEGE